MSERETWAQFIKDEYDQFNANESCGRIADAIIADKTLLERKHADDVATLRAAPAQEPVAASGPVMKALVDWTYLHATEGEQWPSSKTMLGLIAKALAASPTQADADAMKRAAPPADAKAAELKCTGCGSTETIAQIKASHPGALSCCPERNMKPRREVDLVKALEEIAAAVPANQGGTQGSIRKRALAALAAWRNP